jgi:tRNA threonylcarbamoyladenosine biosynthesis protein TsaE
MHVSDLSAVSVNTGGELPGFSCLLPDEAATLALGARVAPTLRAGLVIWLIGELGAGKTTLVRGLLRGLNFHGRVKSPTFSLVEIYELSSFNVYHFDLYRFVDPGEWEDAGLRDYFNDESVCLVEWPEKGRNIVPEPDLQIRLELAGEGRQARVTGMTEAGRQCLERLSGS